MIGRIVRVLLLAGVLLLSSSILSAQERWVYRYNGPENSGDWASSVVIGSGGNVYATGRSYGTGSLTDLTVVSLAASGAERWVYRYNGPGNSDDWAYSIAVGPNGNLYAAGGSGGTGGPPSCDFTVVSLTATGAERWVYRYNGPADSFDLAYSIIVGSDGNLYAAGHSVGIGTSDDLTVVSLTTTGAERWVYRYNSPGNRGDWAYSIVMGSDGNLYAAGSNSGSGVSCGFAVVSLTTTGAERWVYQYDGPGDNDDVLYSIVMGLGGNLYAAGGSYGDGTGYDLTVVSLTASGTERWIYRYDGPENGGGLARSIVVGSDGNLYAAGWSVGSGTFSDFTVVGLTDSGAERWIYRYNGPGNGGDYARSIVMGSDGNLYAAGYSSGSGTSSDFTVVSLMDSGAERWIYRYDGSESGLDLASSIVMGSDGNLYAAGQSDEIGTSVDFLLVSLSPEVGVEEHRVRPFLSELRLPENFPNPFYYSTTISYSLPIAAKVTLSIYDITGRLVETLVNETQQPGHHQVRWDRKDNPSGVYFYRLQAGEFVETRKMVVVE